MNMIILAGVCSLMIPVYFFILMADGRKLRERLREREAAPLREAQEHTRPLIAHAFPMWTAPRFCRAEAAGGGGHVQFDSPDNERPGAGREFAPVRKTDLTPDP